jgi:hypothetical protein
MAVKGPKVRMRASEEKVLDFADLDKCRVGRTLRFRTESLLNLTAL